MLKQPRYDFRTDASRLLELTKSNKMKFQLQCLSKQKLTETAACTLKANKNDLFCLCQLITHVSLLSGFVLKVLLKNTKSRNKMLNLNLLLLFEAEQKSIRILGGERKSKDAHFKAILASIVII